MTKLKEELDQSYWDDRWVNKQTGWDIGYASTPLVEYFNQIDDKKLRILIPGCGNAYEAEHLVNEGFSNVHVVDISKTAIDNFLTRFPKFPRSQAIHADFFKLDSEYDIIVEQTFFVPFIQRSEVLMQKKLGSCLAKMVSWLGFYSTPYSNTMGHHLVVGRRNMKPISKDCFTQQSWKKPRIAFHLGWGVNYSSIFQKEARLPVAFAARQ